MFVNNWPLCIIGFVTLFVGNLSNICCKSLKNADHKIMKRADDESGYDRRFESLDIEKILHTQRLFNNYVNCILDKGPCTAEGRELKRILPEVIQTGCKKCSQNQKKQAGTILSFLLQERRDIWNELTLKYDPDGTIRKKYGIDQDDDDDDEDGDNENGDEKDKE